VENNGYQVWFAHLAEVHVSEGEIVPYDQVVGLVGSTGNSTGPHLHYEIIVNGVPINPRNYILED